MYVGVYRIEEKISGILIWQISKFRGLADTAWYFNLVEA